MTGKERRDHPEENIKCLFSFFDTCRSGNTCAQPAITRYPAYGSNAAWKTLTQSHIFGFLFLCSSPSDIPPDGSSERLKLLFISRWFKYVSAEFQSFIFWSEMLLWKTRLRPPANWTLLDRILKGIFLSGALSNLSSWYLDGDVEALCCVWFVICYNVLWLFLFNRCHREKKMTSETITNETNSVYPCLMGDMNVSGHLPKRKEHVNCTVKSYCRNILNVTT